MTWKKNSKAKGDVMEDAEIRLECLRLAAEAEGPFGVQNIRTAELLFTWVKSGISPNIVDNLEDDHARQRH